MLAGAARAERRHVRLKLPALDQGVGVVRVVEHTLQKRCFELLDREGRLIFGTETGDVHEPLMLGSRPILEPRVPYERNWERRAVGDILGIDGDGLFAGTMGLCRGPPVQPANSFE